MTKPKSQFGSLKIGVTGPIYKDKAKQAAFEERVAEIVATDFLWRTKHVSAPLDMDRHYGETPVLRNGGLDYTGPER